MEATKIALNLLLIMLMPLIKKAATRIKSNYLHGKLCLGALSIFCEWAQTHYELISGDSYLWDEIAPLLSHLARTPFSESDFNLNVMDRESLPLLPEEIELRGFKHLAEAHRALPLFSAHAEPSDFDLPNMEGLYHAIRISKILSFGTFIVNIYGQHHLIYQPESKLFSSRKTLRSGNSSRSRRRSKRSASSPTRSARSRASKPTRTRALVSKPSAPAVSDQRSASGRPTLSESSPSVLATSPVQAEKITRQSQAKEVVSVVPDVEALTLASSAPSANQRSRVRRIADDDADQEEVFFNEDGVLEQDEDEDEDSENEEGDEDDDDEYEYEEEEIEYEEYVEDDEYDEEEEIRQQQEEADSEDEDETPQHQTEKNSRSQADQQRGLQTSQAFLSSGLSPLVPPSSSSSSSSSWSSSPLSNTSFFSAAPIATLPTGPSLWPSWDQSQFFAQDGTKQTNQYQLFSRDAFLSKLSDQYSSDKT